MRTWGRVTDAYGNKTWQEVLTDANGFNDSVYVTTICQVLKLSPNESPFFANYGIPSQQSVIQQIFPDYYVSLTQSQFSQFFASLTISRYETATGNPTYNVNVVTHVGSSIIQKVPV